MGIFTESLAIDLVTIAVAITTAIIIFLKQRYTYWQKQGVPTLPTLIPFGNGKDVFLKKKNLGELNKEFYDHFKSISSMHGGVYLGANPVYIPISLDLIKRILQTDFSYFNSHGVYHNEQREPLTGHLFNLDGPKWKDMRVKLTPTFTSGKMKMMFQTFIDCTVGLKDIMQTSAMKKQPIDIKELMGCFTTDIIGSCGFGIECNSLKDPNGEFRKYGKKIFGTELRDQINAILRVFFPERFLYLIGFKRMSNDLENFFMNAVKDTVEYREKNNIFRKDFMHLLIQLKNLGKITDDDNIHVNAKQENSGLTIEQVAAQAFVFFAAGFETSSTTMTFAVYELCQNPKVQDKLRKEINDVLAKHNNEITYDAIMEMSYLQKVIEETLRKHPPATQLPRKCTKDYSVPNTSLVIKKGTRVMIPVMGIHHDPEYYPNPEVFDPERFSEENKAKRPALTWMPFGEGPRMCIGLRFGLLQSKVGLVALIKNFRISLNNKTKVPLVYERNSLVLSVDGGVWIDVEPVNS